MKKLTRKLMALLLMVAVLAMVGCANLNAEEVAEQFNEALVSGGAFTSSHLNVVDNETLESFRDSDGNIKIVYTYEEGVEEFYLIDGVYTYYLDGEVNTEYYTDEEIQGVIDYTIEDVLFYPEDSMQALDFDIDSDVVESDEKNAFVIAGEYEEGGNYSFFYGTDGTFFELIDSIDVIRTDLDDSVVVELPQ